MHLSKVKEADCSWTRSC